MKIKSVETFVVRIPYDEGKVNWGAGFWAKDPNQHPGLPADHPGDITTEYPPVWRFRALYPKDNETVIVRIETDNGIVGWGDAHTPVGGQVSKAVIDSLFAPLLYGKNPLDIQPIWELLYSTMRLRGHSQGFQLEAISGIDIALWDIAGKALNTPVYKLLGGQMRDRIPVYASSLPRVHQSSGEAGWQGLADAAREIKEQGFLAFKVKLGIDLDRDRHALRVLKEAVGDEIKIGVDVNGAYDFAYARKAGRMMQEEGAWWIEEPLMPENLRDYTRLAEYLDIIVAGGECLCNRWIFNDFLAAGAMDLIQPDVSRAGGISECKRISDLADIYGVPFAPHISTGTAIYMAASLQWAAAGPNLMTCEWPLSQKASGNDILSEPFDFRDGFVHVSDRPGLGIDIDEATLRAWAVA
ncbi:MAG: mandelate racemase/muconate lactonizing enzyme family protein [Burkholderiales bacterium]|nr:mandelate racemase/muconate lactonizing enzyme family protein [Anaerolineae bacterium]